MPRGFSQEQHREGMRHFANHERDIADEAALKWKCDDPLHPYTLNDFRDWLDFVDRVARPLVEADGDDEKTQAAMALYRKASPYFICVSLVMAANRIGGSDDQRFTQQVGESQASIDSAEGPR